MAIYGSKSKRHAEHLFRVGKAVEFAKANIGQYPNRQIVNAISVKFAVYACEVGDAIRIYQSVERHEFVTVG
jgi:hypothetical protein